MGIKQKSGPLQSKNVNTLSSNKNSLLDFKPGYTNNQNHKHIEFLQEKLLSNFGQDQVKSRDRSDTSQMTIDPYSNQDQNFVIDSHNNNVNSFNFLRNFNSMSLMYDLLQEKSECNDGYADTSRSQDLFPWCEDKYITKFPHYSKRTIDYNLSILQERSLENNDEMMGIPDSISTPIDLTTQQPQCYCSDDLNMVMNIFNSSQIGHFPIIGTPPMVKDNTQEMLDVSKSLSEFYRSYSYIPEPHYVINKPLQIIQPVPILHGSGESMVPYRPTMDHLTRNYPPFQIQESSFELTSHHNQTSDISLQSNSLIEPHNYQYLPDLEPDL